MGEPRPRNHIERSFFSFIQCPDRPGVGRRVSRTTTRVLQPTQRMIISWPTRHHWMRSCVALGGDGSKKEMENVRPTTPPPVAAKPERTILLKCAGPTPMAPRAGPEDPPSSVVRRFPAPREQVGRPVMRGRLIGAYVNAGPQIAQYVPAGVGACSELLAGRNNAMPRRRISARPAGTDAVRLLQACGGTLSRGNEGQNRGRRFRSHVRAPGEARLPASSGSSGVREETRPSSCPGLKRPENDPLRPRKAHGFTWRRPSA